jgi:hypothetical protein
MLVNLRTFGSVGRFRPERSGASDFFSFRPVRTRLLFGGTLLLTFLGAGLSARAQQRRATLLPASNEDPSYRKEFIYGVNFNTRGGLIGGVSVRSTRPLNQNWSRFWSVEGVEVKHPKEYKIPTAFGGLYVDGKANYMFVVRPSVGLQRVIFRKAPDSGVQVNALVGAGPSVALLMPYYITYDYTLRDSRNNAIGATDYRNEQFDPQTHAQQRIVDRAPLFSGISQTKPNLGLHLRGALSFEYGRYRDAVAGVETGFLFEAYPKRLTILRALQVPDGDLNSLFFPSVYLTIYLGHRS